MTAHNLQAPMHLNLICHHLDGPGVQVADLSQFQTLPWPLLMCFTSLEQEKHPSAVIFTRHIIPQISLRVSHLPLCVFFLTSE